MAKHRNKPIVSIESDRVKLSLPTGESLEILLYGATVIYWNAGGKERLFLSEKTKLDGSKAVRGGIPVVFPVFGRATEGPAAGLPSHGFARISKWKVLGKIEQSETSIQVNFGLGHESLSADLRKQWPFDFGLIYSVVLSKSSLETKLLVHNQGNVSFDFNALFHTYLRVPDVTTVAVTGLKGVTYKDKTQGVAQVTDVSEEVLVAGEIDRVYANVPGIVEVKDGEETLFTIQRSNIDDVVVWNPWTGAADIVDFGPPDGYKNMLCVEAGAVSVWHTLAAQSFWQGGVTLTL